MYIVNPTERYNYVCIISVIIIIDIHWTLRVIIKLNLTKKGAYILQLQSIMVVQYKEKLDQALHVLT